MKDTLLRDSYEPAEKFFNRCDSDFIPAVMRGDIDIARNRISLSMKAHSKDKSIDESHKIDKRSGTKVNRAMRGNRKKKPFNNPFMKLNEK